MAASTVSIVRQDKHLNQVVVRFNPTDSYTTGGVAIDTLLQALTQDGDKIVNGILDIKAGMADSGTLSAVWVWNGNTKLMCFCMVTGVEAANGLDVSTAKVNLLVTYI